ncbi:MAG: carboxylating nicotinate-nucleotide diphosphorylase [Candidatus Erginobacter occultus]|nr:carboxylating nicotinate-nucleotide diphosphorylase [Candidatus Erginobacter occultus]
MDFEIYRGLIQQVLAEDIGAGDITTEALVPEGERGKAEICARQKLVTVGLPLARLVFRELDPALEVEIAAGEGETVEAGTVLLRLEGKLRPILTGERTALNILQHLCGVATKTARFVERVRPAKTRILDTRKTLPGLRRLEKYAVLMGGGENHRFGLYDAILIKDNHLAVVAGAGEGKIARAIRLARAARPGLPVEIEVETVEEMEEALAAGAEAILLDNFPPAELEEAVRRGRGKTRLEASGGIDLGTISDVAATGVESVSLGCLTHSAPAADIALELVTG